MNTSMESLLAELEQVRNSPLQYLPEYGYSSKEEVAALIEEDIRRMEEEGEEEDDAPYYGEGELEEERRRLCLSLGIPRYC